MKIDKKNSEYETKGEKRMNDCSSQFEIQMPLSDLANVWRLERGPYARIKLFRDERAHGLPAADDVLFTNRVMIMSVVSPNRRQIIAVKINNDCGYGCIAPAQLNGCGILRVAG